jgi:hypothetical protein
MASRDAPTFAQLGDATDPAAHAAGFVVDDDRDELPEGAARPQDFPLPSRFAFRMTGQPARYPNQSARDDGRAGTSTVGEHEQRGQADPRRQSDTLTTAGYPVAPERTSTTREQRQADPQAGVSIPGVTPLTAPRAGSTSADPAHNASVPRYLYDRPFDQAIAHHPPELSKLPMPSPLASSPVHQTIATPGGDPVPGGTSGVTAWEPLSVWRNTVRPQPAPYDETAVVGSEIQPVTARRWRL